MLQVWLGFQAGYILQVWRRSRTNKTKNQYFLYNILRHKKRRELRYFDVSLPFFMSRCIKATRIGWADGFSGQLLQVRERNFCYILFDAYIFLTFSENCAIFCFTSMHHTVLHCAVYFLIPVLSSIFYIVLNCPASSYIVLHCPTLSFIVLHCPGLSALSWTILHCSALS